MLQRDEDNKGRQSVAPGTECMGAPARESSSTASSFSDVYQCICAMQMMVMMMRTRLNLNEMKKRMTDMRTYLL